MLTQKEVLKGHCDTINGVLPIPNTNNFISWSDDCTLILWSWDNASSIVLKEHNTQITNAIVTNHKL